MILIHAANPAGIWTGGPYNRFLSSFLSHHLQPEVQGFSMGMVVLPPGGGSEPHAHAGAQESWFVLEGEGTVSIGSETRPIRAGDVIYGPAGVMHALSNTSGQDYLKLVLVLCPGGDERNVTDHLEERGVLFEEGE